LVVSDMVYCTKCGAENEEDAVECKSCGAPLRPPSYRTYRRREEDWCFGTRGGVPVFGVLFGILIIIWGITALLGDVYRWAQWDSLWPVFIIAFGLLIVINVLSKR
jgi:ribosomal protein L40E